jgi:2-methylcitrate dehydratase PrpD
VTAESSFVSAQFSSPYVVAACLVDGDMGPAQLREERISDPAILKLSQKVKVDVDPELASAYPATTASRVEVRLKSGETLVRQVDIPKGDPRDPMTAADLTGKLRRFAARKDDKAVERIARLSLELENVGDIRELTSII